MDLNYKNFNQYYSLVGENTLNDLCKNDNLKHLLNLSSLTDINIFNKKNDKWQIKNKNILLKECEKIKKKELKSSTNLLSNLAKLNNSDLNNIKNIYKNLEVKIDTINKIIDIVSLINQNESSKENTYNFIEYYSNS
jgi:hypothetical protein